MVLWDSTELAGNKFPEQADQGQQDLPASFSETVESEKKLHPILGLAQLSQK